MQIGEWLGMIINMVKFQFHIIPPRKIEKDKKNIECLLAFNHVSYRELAKIAGFIKSPSHFIWLSTHGFSRVNCFLQFF